MASARTYIDWMLALLVGAAVGVAVLHKRGGIDWPSARRAARDDLAREESRLSDAETKAVDWYRTRALEQRARAAQAQEQARLEAAAADEARLKAEADAQAEAEAKAKADAEARVRAADEAKARAKAAALGTLVIRGLGSEVSVGNQTGAVVQAAASVGTPVHLQAQGFHIVLIPRRAAEEPSIDVAVTPMAIIKVDEEARGTSVSGIPVGGAPVRLSFSSPKVGDVGLVLTLKR